DKTAKLAEHLSAFKKPSESLSSFTKLLRDAGKNAPDSAAARLSDWQRLFVGQLKQSFAPFHPQDLDLDQLPVEMRGHYVGMDGTFALYVYPTQDLWVQKNLADFVNDIEARMKNVPGTFTLTG